MAISVFLDNRCDLVEEEEYDEEEEEVEGQVEPLLSHARESRDVQPFLTRVVKLEAPECEVERLSTRFREEFWRVSRIST